MTKVLFRFLNLSAGKTIFLVTVHLLCYGLWHCVFWHCALLLDVSRTACKKIK